jgi:hypothetical protein
VFPRGKLITLFVAFDTCGDGGPFGVGDGI